MSQSGSPRIAQYLDSLPVVNGVEFRLLIAFQSNGSDCTSLKESPKEKKASLGRFSASVFLQFGWVQNERQLKPVAGLVNRTKCRNRLMSPES